MKNMLRPNRMRFLLAFSCVLAMQSSRAQKQFNVLDWKSDVSLNSWLVSRMHDQYDKRSKEFNRALSSRKATEAYIQDVRNKYLRLLGSFPERSPLQAKTTG